MICSLDLSGQLLDPMPMLEVCSRLARPKAPKQWADYCARGYTPAQYASVLLTGYPRPDDPRRDVGLWDRVIRADSRLSSSYHFSPLGRQRWTVADIGDTIHEVMGTITDETIERVFGPNWRGLQAVLRAAPSISDLSLTMGDWYGIRAASDEIRETITATQPMASWVDEARSAVSLLRGLSDDAIIATSGAALAACAAPSPTDSPLRLRALARQASAPWCTATGVSVAKILGKYSLSGLDSAHPPW